MGFEPTTAWATNRHQRVSMSSADGAPARDGTALSGPRLRYGRRGSSMRAATGDRPSAGRPRPASMGSARPGSAPASGCHAGRRRWRRLDISSRHQLERAATRTDLDGPLRRTGWSSQPPEPRCPSAAASHGAVLETGSADGERDASCAIAGRARVSVAPKISSPRTICGRAAAVSAATPD